jgi:hypothetical protein
VNALSFVAREKGHDRATAGAITQALSWQRDGAGGTGQAGPAPSRDVQFSGKMREF